MAVTKSGVLGCQPDEHGSDLSPKVLPLFNKFQRMRRRWFGEVSQTKISYSASSLSKGRAGVVEAGSRFPYFFLSQQGSSVSVYHLLREYRATAFLVFVYNLPGKALEGLDKTLFHVLMPEVNAANTAALKEAGFPASFIVLLRPDGYIGYISATVDVNELNEFMKGAYRLEYRDNIASV